MSVPCVFGFLAASSARTVSPKATAPAIRRYVWIFVNIFIRQLFFSMPILDPFADGVNALHSPSAYAIIRTVNTYPSQISWAAQNLLMHLCIERVLLLCPADIGRSI